MGRPQVSVIVPAYNAAEYLAAALGSVLSQTWTDLEVLVVDDESSDRTVEVAERFGPPVVCVRQPHGGVAKARNTGIAAACGRLIAFLDADDVWLPEKLQRQVEYFERWPSTGLLHTATLVVNRGGTSIPRAAQSPSRAATPPTHMFCDLFHNDVEINALTVMVPRAVLDDVGLFDERPEIHVEDWDLWLRIAARYPIGYLPGALAVHYRGGLMSTAVDKTRRGQELVIQKTRPLCQEACARHQESPAACLSARWHRLYQDIGYAKVQAGDRAGARREFRRALTYRPFAMKTQALLLTCLVRDRAPDSRWRPGTTPVDGPGTSKPVPMSDASSMLHDTVYRRARRAAAAALHAVDSAVSSFGRPPHRVLFEAASPLSFAIVRPVYDRLAHDPRLEFWFTASGSAWSAEALFKSVGITDRVVSARQAAWMKVDAYVNTDFWDTTWLRRRARRVHMFHGVAGKYGLDAPVDIAPTVRAFDCLMFPNADRLTRYVDAGLVAPGTPAAALVGYPKVDCLVDGSLDAGAIASRLGLDRRAPIVLYAPTWSPHSMLNARGEQIIDALAAAGLQVIVKLHDRSYDLSLRASGGIDWAERLRRFDRHPRVRVVRDGDACPYLYLSDALVTGYSSIGFEYMLLDRPLVVIEAPDLMERARINPEKVALLRSAAEAASTPEEAARAVLAQIAHPTPPGDRRRRIASELFYRPGTAAARAAVLMYDLLGLTAPSAAVGSERPAEAAPASRP